MPVTDIPEVAEALLHLDRMPRGKLPPMLESGSSGLVFWALPGGAMWLRVDQLDELRAVIEVAMRDLDSEL